MWIFYRITLFVFCSACVYAETFDEASSSYKSYVVQQLAEILANSSKSNSIVVVHDRIDEPYRNHGELKVDLMLALDLRRVRFVETLKGVNTYSGNEVLYFYPIRYQLAHTDQTREQITACYEPQFIPDDFIKVLFVCQSTIPIVTRLNNDLGHSRINMRIKTFIADAQALGKQDFLNKYGLTTICSNKVFEIQKPAIFSVACEKLQPLPDTESMRSSREQIENLRRTIPASQHLSNLLHLTRREVSEIVYIAYLFDGEDGSVKYVEAAMKSKILEPMAEVKFTTQIGQKLYEKVKPKVIAGVNEMKVVGERK